MPFIFSFHLNNNNKRNKKKKKKKRVITRNSSRPPKGPPERSMLITKGVGIRQEVENKGTKTKQEPDEKKISLQYYFTLFSLNFSYRPYFNFAGY